MNTRAILVIGSALISACSLAQTCDPALIRVGEHGDGVRNVTMSVADFNNDGHMDLITMSLPVQVLLGSGDGTFTPGWSETVLARHSHVLGDFNNDGNMDCVIDDVSQDKASLMFGIGDGSFADPITLDAGVLGITHFAAGDLNNDGISDLVIAGLDTALAVLISTGDGTFEVPLLLPTGPGNDYWNPVEIGDVDNDGDADIVLAKRDFRVELEVFLNNGDGTFAPFLGTLLSVGGVQSLKLADANEDGFLDAIVTGPGVGLVLPGIGDGLFGDEMPLNSSGWSMVVADFNRDTHVDVVTFRDQPRTIELMLGNGDATFQPAQVYPESEDPLNGAVGDFNEDGRPDLASNHYEDFAYVSIYLNDCGCAADLDGDQDADADDFFDFLDFFAADDSRADIDGNGVIDSDDFFRYLDLFAAGCD